MSVSSEITRIKNAKNSLKNAINNKLVSDKITNETIDDYAEKVSNIVIPSGEVIEGVLATATGKGKNLEKRNYIYMAETYNLIKVTANYFIDFSTDSIKLLKYIDDKMVTIDSISQISTSKIDEEIYEDNGDYYIIFQQSSSNISVLYTNLSKINVVAHETITLDNLVQVDYNKFVNYTVDTSTNKEIKVCSIIVNFNRENTSINISDSESILSTTDNIDEYTDYDNNNNMGIIGQNRFVFWIGTYNTNNRTNNLKVVVCTIDDVDGTIIKLHRDSSISSTYTRDIFPPHLAVTEFAPGIIGVKEGVISPYDDDVGYYTINDSQIIFTPGNYPYDDVGWNYSFSLSEVMRTKRIRSGTIINYVYELYSIDKYTCSFIIDVTNEPSARTPRNYKNLNEKTIDNLILSNTDIIYPSFSPKLLRVYKNSIALENLKYYYYSSLSGGYISAEAGEIGDKIKIYSPSIE